jgi:hypothetical protein
MMNKEIVMKPWDLLSKLEQYSCIYSDMHKDAYGFRPRCDTSSWTAENFEAEFAVMADVIRANEVENERVEKTNIENFKTSVLKFMAWGAKNERTALLWMVGDENLQSPQEVEHWVWKQGFLFSEYGEKVVNELCEMLFEEENV